MDVFKPGRADLAMKIPSPETRSNINCRLTLFERESPIAKDLVAPTTLGTVATLTARVLAIRTAEIMVRVGLGWCLILNLDS